MSEQAEDPAQERSSSVPPAVEDSVGVPSDDPQVVPTGTHPAAVRPQRSGFWVLLERYMVAHLIAYPIGSIAAVVAMPFTLWLRGGELNKVGTRGARHELFRELAVDMGLGPVEAAQMELVTESMIAFALLMMLIPHIAGLPWAWVRARPVTDLTAQLRRERWSDRVFWGALGASGVSLVVGALVGYGWFFIAL